MNEYLKKQSAGGKSVDLTIRIRAQHSELYYEAAQQRGVFPFASLEGSFFKGTREISEINFPFVFPFRVFFARLLRGALKTKERWERERSDVHTSQNEHFDKSHLEL
jgi:hypothetical protein